MNKWSPSITGINLGEYCQLENMQQSLILKAQDSGAPFA
jgi:hypothetical protein